MKFLRILIVSIWWICRLRLTFALTLITYSLDYYQSEDAEWLFSLSYHQFILAGTNFRHPNRGYATWHWLPSSQKWAHTDHIVISHKKRGWLHNCRSFWSTRFDLDHPLPCTKLSMRRDERPKHPMQESVKLQWPFWLDSSIKFPRRAG